MKSNAHCSKTLAGNQPCVHWERPKSKLGDRDVHIRQAWHVNQEVGEVNPELPHTSDLNLWLRIASESDVAYLPGPLQKLHRLHALNHSGDHPRNISMELHSRSPGEI
jgi:hypothetical protein